MCAARRLAVAAMLMRSLVIEHVEPALQAEVSVAAQVAACDARVAPPCLASLCGEAQTQIVHLSRRRCSAAGAVQHAAAVV